MPVIEGFAMPEALVVDEQTATARYARFVLEPWEKGYGHTLGNALRRALISSMEGVAVSSIRIDGVAQEFTSIPNVVEDVTAIVLNVKKLRLLCHGDMPRTLELYADKGGPVTAAAIKEDAVTEVLNPDLCICTLDQDVPFRMELEIDRGRGYRPAEENKREDQPIGVIPVDCLFSPVERVRYDVQACRVGQRTDYDRLELEIWTDARINPRQALHHAGFLLREHLSLFVEATVEETPMTQITSAEDKELLEKLCISVNSLELSVRAKNCLNTAQIRFLGDLIDKTESEMLKYRNFGKKSLQEIKARLSELGLTLGSVLREGILAAYQQRVEQMDKED